MSIRVRNAPDAWRATAAALVLAALLSAVVASAAEDDRALLRRVADHYRRATRFHLTGKVDAEMKSTAGDQTTEAQFDVASGGNGRVRDRLALPGNSMTRVSDGKQSWLYLAERGEYAHRDAPLPSPDQLDSTQITSLGGMTGILLANFRGLARDIDSLSALPDETLTFGSEKRQCRVLKVSYAAPPGGVAISRVLWIDPQRAVVLRQRSRVIAQVQGDASAVQSETMTFTTVSMDQPLPDSLFTFRPPEGVRKVDAFNSNDEENLRGQMAADFELTDLAGHQHTLQEHRGKVVLLDFWASWCGPCRMQMPAVDKLYQELKTKGLVVYAVNERETAARARAYFKKYGYGTTALLDESGKVGMDYKVQALPTLFVIGRDGKIVAHYVGLHPEDALREALKNAGLD